MTQPPLSTKNFKMLKNLLPILSNDNQSSRYPVACICERHHIAHLLLNVRLASALPSQPLRATSSRRTPASTPPRHGTYPRLSPTSSLSTPQPRHPPFFRIPSPQSSFPPSPIRRAPTQSSFPCSTRALFTYRPCQVAWIFVAYTPVERASRR